MKVFLMQGITGSGKSTWIRKRIRQNPNEYYGIVSADDFIVEMGNGEYIWTPALSLVAHRKALKLYVESVTNNELDTVYVDNTNLKPMDISPYYRVAEALGHDVKIIQLWIDRITAKRSLHVDKDWVIDNQHRQLEKLVMPKHWKIIKG